MERSIGESDRAGCGEPARRAPGLGDKLANCFCLANVTSDEARGRARPSTVSSCHIEMGEDAYHAVEEVTHLGQLEQVLAARSCFVSRAEQDLY